MCTGIKYHSGTHYTGIPVARVRSNTQLSDVSIDGEDEEFEDASEEDEDYDFE